MEIEHKYLVISDNFLREATHRYHIVQGYLSKSSPTMRVRIRDEEAFITIKGPSDESGLVRQEFEYSIPKGDAEQLMQLCQGRTLEKYRYLVPYEGEVWEVDVFLGRHEGLMLAELEVESLDSEFALPPWVGQEVSREPQYRNAFLALKL